jgi:hypothetical protein
MQADVNACKWKASPDESIWVHIARCTFAAFLYISYYLYTRIGTYQLLRIARITRTQCFPKECVRPAEYALYKQVMILSRPNKSTQIVFPRMYSARFRMHSVNIRMYSANRFNVFGECSQALRNTPKCMIEDRIPRSLASPGQEEWWDDVICFICWSDS